MGPVLICLPRIHSVPLSNSSTAGLAFEQNPSRKLLTAVLTSLAFKAALARLSCKIHLSS